MKTRILNDIGYNSNLEQYRKDNNLDTFSIGRVVSEHKDRYIVKTETKEFDAELIGHLRFNTESQVIMK